MDKVGKDGVITVEEAKSTATTLEVVEGMQFDQGYLSPYFVTDPERMEAKLEDAYILIHEKKISSMKDLLPVLESIAKTGKPFLMIAEDIEGEALATLVVNKLRGTLQVAAVKAPGYGDRRKAMLEDIAVLTNGRAVTEDLGIRLDSLGLADLGSARKVTISKDTTTIIEGGGASAAIEGRVRQLRAQVLRLLLAAGAPVSPAHADAPGRSAGLTGAQIEAQFPGRDPREVQAVVCELVDEGFLTLSEGCYRVA